MNSSPDEKDLLSTGASSFFAPFLPPFPAEPFPPGDPFPPAPFLSPLASFPPPLASLPVAAPPDAVPPAAAAAFAVGSISALACSLDNYQVKKKNKNRTLMFFFESRSNHFVDILSS